MTPMRAIWFTIGTVALLLGALGIVLPLLPTTPFLLVAAFSFARSSDRCHQWLLDHKIFGRIIKNWNAHGAIDKRTKIIGTSSMAGIFALSLAMGISPFVLGIQALALGASATFVLTRPLPPEQ